MKRLVLLGQTGSGKTTLFNRLTGNNEETAAGGETTTRLLVCGYSIYETNFEVIDSPDLQDIEKGILQVAGFMAGLQVGSINQIILVIKYERYQSMKKQIESQFKLIERYLNNITVYISFFDLCDQAAEKNEEQMIRDKILKDFKIKLIIFNKKNLDDQSIAKQIFSIIKSSSSFNVNIQENQILNYFEYHFSYELDDYYTARDQMIMVLKQQVKRIQQSLNKLKLNNPKCLRFFQSLEDDAIKKASECFNYFIQYLRSKMYQQLEDGILSYLSFQYLLQESKSQLNYILIKLSEKGQVHPESIFKKYKKCPYCNHLMINTSDNNTVNCQGAGCNESFLWEQDLFKRFLFYKTALQPTDREIQTLRETKVNRLIQDYENNMKSKDYFKQIIEDGTKLNELIKQLIVKRKIIKKKS